MDKTRISLSTPGLRTLVVHLHRLDTKLAAAIVKVDGYVQSNKFLREVFGSLPFEDKAPPMNVELVKKTLILCKEIEDRRAKLPKPWDLMVEYDKQEEKEEEKA